MRCKYLGVHIRVFDKYMSIKTTPNMILSDDKKRDIYNLIKNDFGVNVTKKTSFTQSEEIIIEI